MDAHELASSILAIGDLVREANRALNVDGAEVSVRVKLDFKKGLFEVSLELDQSLLVRAKNLLLPGSGAGIGAGALVRVLFGTETGKKGVSRVIENVLDLWKELKGENPTASMENKARGITTFVLEDGSEIHVNSKAATLYDKEAVRSAIAGIVGPVARREIKTLEIRKGKRSMNQVQKSDLPQGLANSISPAVPPLGRTPTQSGPVASQVTDGGGWKTAIYVITESRII